MAAESDETQKYMKRVFVKTLSGDIINIEFDTREEDGLVKALHKESPDEFPLLRTKLTRITESEGSSENTNKVIGNIRNTVNGDTFMAFVDTVTSLRECKELPDHPTDKGPIIRYQFDISRKDGMNNIIYETGDYHKRFDDEEKNNLTQKYLQPLCIYYIPITRKHYIGIFDLELDILNLQNFTTFRKMLTGQIEYNYEPDYNYLKEKGIRAPPSKLRSTAGKEQGLSRVLYKLKPEAIEEIIQAIKECPLTPKDALIFSTEGGYRRKKYSQKRTKKRIHRHKKKTIRKYRK